MKAHSAVEYQARRDSLILMLIGMASYGLLTIMAVAAIVDHNAEQAEPQIVYCVPAPTEEAP